MMQYVILETLTGVSEIILVFHEAKKRCYLREAANIHPEKHNILVFLSNTLFPPFYIEHLSKTYRREHVSAVLSTPIWFVCCTD